MSFWMRTIRKLISITRGTYNARKFWTRRTSGSVRHRTITWKYAYKILTLHSGSLTRSGVMNFGSSARDRSSRIDYWTLNSRNVNSMFAANARFMLSRSQMSTFHFTFFEHQKSTTWQKMPHTAYQERMQWCMRVLVSATSIQMSLLQ